MKKRENPSKYIQMSYQTTNCLVNYLTYVGAISRAT